MTPVKLQKLQKCDYAPAQRLNVNVLLSNITFFIIFAVLVVSFAVNVSKLQFLSRISILTRDIDMTNLSVCLSVCSSVCLSVRYVPVPYENGP